jgi:hypothetical protein
VQWSEPSRDLAIVEPCRLRHFGPFLHGKDGLSFTGWAVFFASCFTAPSRQDVHLTKPFSGADENVLKQRRPTFPVHQTTGIVMLTRLLNAIYRKFLSAAVPGIIREGARR